MADNLTQKQIEAIENSGYDAFANGDERSDNPHKIGSEEHIIWLQGFDEAGTREQNDEE
ncbi:TPA: hypothetical protein HA278_04315 [Candidatus Woesearchaeota archaeon]|jgi:hypothetical protein|nr:hypothetical protein [Candidatus Woesearchaeota archaeon]